MYVTDVPVMDRLTDRTWSELWPAFNAFEGRMNDLIFTAEDVPAVLEHARGCGEDCGELAGQLQGLSEATEAALAARDTMSEALALVGIEQL